MLKPNKYTKIDISLVAIAAELLKILRSSENVTYTSLLNKIVNIKGIESKNIFLPALNFLFLLDKVEYHKRGDVLTYKT